jgi:MBOAT, membrane-bound O-acyltransferase family
VSVCGCFWIFISLPGFLCPPSLPLTLLFSLPLPTFISLPPSIHFPPLFHSLPCPSPSLLPRYTYLRSGRSLTATYFISAFWHGLYPGFFLFFMSIPLMTNIERLIKVRERRPPSCLSCITSFYPFHRPVDFLILAPCPLLPLSSYPSTHLLSLFIDCSLLCLTLPYSLPLKSISLPPFLTSTHFSPSLPPFPPFPLSLSLPPLVDIRSLLFISSRPFPPSFPSQSKINPLVVPGYDGYNAKTYPSTPIATLYWGLSWLCTTLTMNYVVQVMMMTRHDTI